MKGKNLLKHDLLKFVFLVTKSLAISVILVATFSKFPISSTLGWMDLGWEYRKPITLSNSGGTLTNEDVLVEVNTAELVTAGKLQVDCDDIRFTDTDENTTLSYWIEGGCNTAATQIWIQVPSIPDGGKTIYMYYGNTSVSSTSLTWSGNVIMYADTACPTGWTRAIDLDGKFLYGGTTYGTTGGADSHTHTNVTTTSSAISTTNIAAGTGGSNAGTATNHTHTGLQASITSATSLPAYKEMILCYKNDFNISSGLISMFDVSAPSGWTRFSQLDSLFARANSTYGTTGGSNTHSHTATGNLTTNTPGTTQSISNTPFSATGGTVTTSGGYTIHTFNSSGTFTTNQAGSVTALVIGGGGGGGTGINGNGGGGAGGFLYSTSVNASSGANTVTVGAGGAANTNGGDSVFSTLTAIGGGAGGASNDAGSTGGSGGGGGCRTYNGAAGTSGQGYAGGNGLYAGGGGGGGAGGAGTNAYGGSENWGGTGGVGVANSITGTSIYYAGGGAGGGSATGGCGSAPLGGTACGTNGAANKGAGGGGNTAAGSAGAGGSGVVIIRYTTPEAASGTIASSTHTHSSSATTTSSDSDLPPYLDMVFAKANSNTYVTSDNVVITTALPPLGWSRFTALDNKFPRGAETYGTTGGAATHTHTVSITTGAPSATLSVYGSGTNFSDTTHTHSGTATTNAVSNLPTYTTVIYSQRKASISAVLGAEDTQNNNPNAPTNLEVGGQSGSPTISDFTPGFTAIFSDVDGDDTGNYYQLEVNTSSDFTGTVMWDSTKTAAVPAISNGGRSSEISYAGAELVSGNTYYWRIKFWDSNTYNNESDWSTTSQFTMNAIPQASASNLSDISDLYANIPINIQAIYSDPDGSTDLDRLYLKVHNPSASADIEYYITATGSDQTGQYPTSVSGSEYISGITYDTQYDTPSGTDITVTWHITTNWTWTQSTELSYGVKALDHGGSTSVYSSTAALYKYENRLTFTGDLSIKDSQNNMISESTWYPANTVLNISGVKVVYYGTTDFYPQDSQFDVKVFNEELTEWYDMISSGENISIASATPTISNSSDTYTLSIVNIPGYTNTATLTFNIKTDVDNPVISTLASTSHPSESTWYEDHTGDISWAIQDSLSGIYKSWRLIDQVQNQTIQNTSTNGTEIGSSGTYNFTINQDGTWYIHIASVDNVGLSTIETYKIQIDSQAPVFSSVTSTTHPSQTTWYTNKTATVNWQIQELGSGIANVWVYPSAHPTEELATISSEGTEKSANDSFTMTDLNNGIWYIHLLASDNTGKTTYTTYTIKIDSLTPDIVDVTGNYEGIWQNIDSGPVISWINPNSVSGNTYYITNNGTEPTSENYAYVTNLTTYNLPSQREGETTIKVRAINGAGAYSLTRSFIIRYDSVAPTNVSSLKAESSTNGILLSWKNPTDTDLQKIVLIRNSNRIPTSVSDGTKLYEGVNNTYLDQVTSREITYYYAIYAYDTVGNISSGATVSSTPVQEVTPEPTDKVIEVANLGTGKQVSVSINNFTPTVLSSNDIHVYSEQMVDIVVPAKTIKDEISNPSQVTLLVGGQTYIMAYNKESDNYTARITAPSVKGAYDTRIKVSDTTDENALTLSLSILVDPYGYIYMMSAGNEVRISNAKVSLYTKSGDKEILWTPMSGETNPQYTNQQGEYQFFVQPGEYKLVVEASGYIPTETEWFTVETNIIEKNIEVKKNYVVLYSILALAEITIGICIFVCFKKKSKKLKSTN